MNPFVKLTVMSLFFVMVFTQQASAEKPIVPKEISGATIVSVSEVKKLLDEGTPIFDVRNPMDYSDGHIPGAISLPYKEKSAKRVGFKKDMDQFDLSALPEDRKTAVIFYCNGERCWKSYKASTTAIEAGYQNVKWFRDGYPSWTGQGYPIEK